MLVAWLIPDVPRSLKDCLKREKALLLDLLLSEEVEKQRRQSQRPANINITINTSEEEIIEMEPERNILLQTENELQTEDLSREDTESTTKELIIHEKDCHKSGETSSLTTSDPQLDQFGPQIQVKPVGTSHYQEFNFKGPPPRDPGSRSRSRCQTLPPRQRGDQSGDSLSRTRHSTSFVQFNQNFPQATSECLQTTPTVPLKAKSKNTSTNVYCKAEIFGSPFSELSRHSLKTELQLKELPRPLSDQEITSSQKALEQLPSEPELLVSHSTALPRPPSRPELSVSLSAVLPRPPAKPELMGSTAKSLPLQDPATRTKSRCRTLPPRNRGPDSVKSSLRTTHSTSFTSINKKSSLPSEVTDNTPV